MTQVPVEMPVEIKSVETKPVEIKTVAVIGAGLMGRGIAHAAALGGYHTILEDLLPGALRKAEDELRANLDKAIELQKSRPPKPMPPSAACTMPARWKRPRVKPTW